MQHKSSKKCFLFLTNKKGIAPLILATILMFSIMTFYSSLENLFGNVQAQAKGESQKIEATNDSEKSNLENGSHSYLAEAGKFEIGDDPTVWILIILFNLALAITIERAWYLYRNRGKNDELLDIVTSTLSKNPNDSKNLIDIVKSKRFGMEGRVAAKTLQGWNFGNMSMNEFSKAALESEKRGLEKRLVVLSTLGNNAPFIGLLGTVLGIMKAFRDLATMGDAGPAVVMAGISEALIATAFGLGVAIPCVIIFNILSKQVRNKLSNAEEIVNMLSGIRAAFETKGSSGSDNNSEENSRIKDEPGKIYKNKDHEIDEAGLPSLAIEVA